MSARIALLAMLACATALRAAEDSPLEIARCDDLVRPPILFRCAIHRAVASEDFARGPLTLQVSLEHGSHLLAEELIQLDHLGQLRDGVGVVLAPSDLDSGQADASAILRVTLANPSRSLIERAAREIATPRALGRDLSRLSAALRTRGEDDPLPWLWAEQGAEIASSGSSAAHCRMLSDLVSELRAWNGGQHVHPAGPLRAYRDPIDGSVQPERVYEPSAPLRGEAWLLWSPPEAPIKSAWMSPPAEWLAAASAAGCRVVVPYPAGDLRWEGASLMRACARIARAPHRVVLVGAGAAGHAAQVIAANQPGHVAAVRTIEQADQRPNETAFWSVDSSDAVGPASEPLHIGGPLAAYASAPFVVVVGLGEHQAAQEDDRALARAFAAAWAAHAHGLPRQIDDDAYRENDWRGYHLVLIGNTRSNRVLGALARHAKLPFAWDSRAVTVASGPQAGTYLRSERRAIAFSLPRSDDPRRSVIVLDGAPAWRAGGLPLADLPDPFLGEPTPPGAGDAGAMMARP